MADLNHNTIDMGTCSEMMDVTLKVFPIILELSVRNEIL
jgi:hypothetical protein